MIKTLMLFVTIFVASSHILFAEIIFRDNFETAISRDVTDDALKFRVAAGGVWNGVWSNQDTVSPNAAGYIYTATSIPGFSGSFPGENSSRVLAMEQLPDTYNTQTNCYLIRGGENFAQDTIPANSWIQFWIYVNRYGSQMSNFTSEGGKWLYPCITGTPTCSPSEMAFLGVLRADSYNPYSIDSSNGDSYHTMEAFGGVSYSDPAGIGAWKIGPNQSSSLGLIGTNEWVLVKIHTDISGSSPLVASGQGVYREWHKRVGGDFVLVADWRGGVTPSSFSWPVSNLASGHTTGQRSLKLGTTFNTYDVWLYVDDFVIAEAEGDLPTYGEEGGDTTASIGTPTGAMVIGQ